MGDGSRDVTASNVLNNYSIVYLNATEIDSKKRKRVLFRCASGLGPNDSNSNDNIGNVYFNGMLLTTGTCNGFIEPSGARFDNRPGVFNVRLCKTRQFNTNTEGIYTCTLKNSSMMNESVSVGVYFSGRSKSLHNYYNHFNFKKALTGMCL